MKIVTVAQMRALEQRADAAGVSYAAMMEAAGRAVADVIAERWNVGEQRILIFTGPGNNGGDGLVAARHLRERGAAVSLYWWNYQKESEVARSTLPSAHAQREFEQQVYAIRAENDADLSRLRSALDRSTIIVDALLGTGANRPIEGLLKSILGAVRQHVDSVRQRRRGGVSPPVTVAQRDSGRGEGTHAGAQTPAWEPDRAPTSPVLRVVAVDLPSGLNADSGALDPTTIAADVTVTFAYPKVGFYKFPAADALGELVVADIGIPQAFAADIALNLATSADAARRLPPRPRSGHKGTFGKAMIVAGSSNYTGAPYLSATAAARTGAGLVTLATTSEVQRIVASALHVATFVPLADADGAIASSAVRTLMDHVQDYDALLFGPGLGRARGTQQFLYRVLDAHMSAALPPRLVVDADGLNALSEQREWWRMLPAQCVLTPHVGEFARLTGLAIDAIAQERESCARAHAQRWGQVVLLKGAFTLVAEADGQVTLLPFANPALATAGSGDVLSGIIVALLAQGLSPADAAIAGGYLHGVAGEMLREQIGDAGAIASDLLELIPQALRLIKS